MTDQWYVYFYISEFIMDMANQFIVPLTKYIHSLRFLNSSPQAATASWLELICSVVALTSKTSFLFLNKAMH